MSNRRTDAETFALGLWAGTAVNELDSLIGHYSAAEVSDAVPPLTALRLLIASARDSGDLVTLDKLRAHWVTAERRKAG